MADINSWEKKYEEACIHVTPCMAHSTVKSLIYSVDIDSEVLKQKLLCSFTAISGRG